MIDVISVPRWRCDLGHEHASLVAAERCVKLREPAWKPREGFKHLYDARDRLWDQDVNISAHEISEICKADESVRTFRYPDHPKGRLYVNVEDLDHALTRAGKLIHD